MDEETYTYLLSLVSNTIQKQNTIMRKCISPHERLTATLRFLATGRSYTDLQYSTIIPKPALSKIIPETCDAIYSALYIFDSNLSIVFYLLIYYCAKLPINLYRYQLPDFGILHSEYFLSIPNIPKILFFQSI